MHQTRRHANGFTLIELLLALTITGTLLFATTALVYAAVSARVQQQSITEVDAQGNAAIDLITQALRNATAIVSPVSGSSDSLQLVTAASPLNPTIFQALNGTLERTQGTGATVSLTNSHVAVTGLAFTNLSRPGTSSIVQVRFTLSRVSSRSTAEYSYQKTFTASAALRQP
ncbi:MAG TPA: prepilin-type N-terminal cleavage/methylation domain-containing protein [Candidatus Saccharimonadales bacterium]|nr:prepilin-type N-terminal cleavage/methylation domain-containing protein [Candidatus Saccharimonadales bacterium]